MMSKKGFTLIELLIVIIIIGVLATLAIPQYTGFVEKARAAEALSMISALKTSEAAYKLEDPNGEYTSDFSQLYVTNVATGSVAANSAGQYWYYEFSGTPDTQTYTILANRSSKGGGNTGMGDIQFTWSDTTGAHWAGTHPGRPK